MSEDKNKDMEKLDADSNINETEEADSINDYADLDISDIEKNTEKSEITHNINNENDKKSNKKTGMNPFKNKKFKYGGLSAAFTLVFVAIVILLNVVLNTLLTRFDVKLDLTENKLYSIEESTSEFLKAIEDKVTITICSTESDYTAIGLVYQQANAIAGKFNSANANIEIKYVDLLTNPAFSGQYGSNLNNVSVIIESEKTGRYKVLQYDEYCNITYSTAEGQQLSYEEASMYSQYGVQINTDVSASAEQAFVSAIMSVCDVNPVRVAFASGFGEGVVAESSTNLYSALEELLEKNAYVIETLDLNFTETIDPAIDFLIIFSPSSDYDVKTLTMIDNWLDNNGLFGKNVIYVASVTNTETPNLDGFLNDWGMKLEKGGMFQTDTSYANTQSGYAQYMLLQESDYTLDITSGTFIGYMMRPVTALFEQRSNITITPILSSFDGAVMVPFDADESWTPDLAETGSLHAIVESKKTSYKDNGVYTSRVIAVGGPYVFLSDYISASNLSNSALYMNIFNVISGKEAGVTMTPKSFALTGFEITASTANTIAIIFAVVLPLLVTAAGITVFIRRRYR